MRVTGMGGTEEVNSELHLQDLKRREFGRISMVLQIERWYLGCDHTSRFLAENKSSVLVDQRVIYWYMSHDKNGFSRLRKNKVQSKHTASTNSRT